MQKCKNNDNITSRFIKYVLKLAIMILATLFIPTITSMVSCQVVYNIPVSKKDDVHRFLKENMDVLYKKDL